MSTADSIAQSAFQLFYRQGFHGTGVEQLSQEAGVTKKTLYRHYPSKELLIEAALERRDREFMERLNTALALAEPGQGGLAYIDFLEAWACSPTFHGCAFINAAAEYADAQEPPHVLAKRHKAQVMTALEQACGDLEAAQRVFLVGEGLIVASQVSGVQEALFEVARGMVRAV